MTEAWRSFCSASLSPLESFEVLPVIFVGANRAILLLSPPASCPKERVMERITKNISDVTRDGRINASELVENEFRKRLSKRFPAIFYIICRRIPTEGPLAG